MPVEQLNGTPISYEVTGEGEPLVLVHGAWVDLHSWGLVAPGLSQSFKVVAYDLRGHGQSTLDDATSGTVHDDIADLAALVTHLGIAPVTVFGVSSGACIALRFAAEHPELVLRVIAQEPPIDSLLRAAPDAGALAEQDRLDREAVRGLIEQGKHRDAAEHFVEHIAIGPGAWASFPPPVQDTFERHAEAFLGQTNDPDAVEVDLEALSSSSVPVVLTRGDQSPAIFTPIMDELERRLPNAQTHTFIGAGHVPSMTHPAELITAIRYLAR